MPATSSILCASNDQWGRTRLRAGVLGLALLIAAGGCSRALDPSAGDVSLALAARTALVNDPAVGAAPIDVHARDGVVTLHGLVASPDEKRHALAVVGAVPGVARVDDRLRVSSDPSPTIASPPSALMPTPESPRDRGRQSALAAEDTSPPGRHVALGGTFTVPTQTINALSGNVAIGPAFRFGRGGGWHPAFSWTRVRSDLAEPAPGADPFGQLRISAVAGGLGHEFTSERWSLDPAVLVGWGFTHVRLDPGFLVPREVRLPVASSGIPVALASATLWLEATDRVSVGFSSGYLFCRPNSTWLDGDRFIRRRLTADVWLASVSVAYWIF